MDRLACLRAFLEVARRGSFARAAEQLSMSNAAVTKHVAALEQSMGARLINRSARHMSLTEAGARVVEGAGELLERYQAIESEVRESVQSLRGAVRIGAPPSFGTFHLMQLVAQFVDRHPDIEVTVLVDDGRADLVAEALDLSVRVGPALQDSSLVAQTLARSPQMLVASPLYLAKHGVPRSLEELAKHNCLVHTRKPAGGVWRFSQPAEQAFRARGTVRSDMGDALKQAALAGTGIAFHPYYMVGEELRKGLLRIVLPDWVPDEMEIHVVYSTRRNMPARVRHLLEFLKQWAQDPPDWLAPREEGWRAGWAAG